MADHPVNGILNEVAAKVARLQAGGALRVVDLFAGCGGTSLGFHRAGYTLRGAVEWDQKAASTHAENFFQDADVETRRQHGQPYDITTFTPAQFSEQVLHAPTPANQVDVVIGGPPCQAFARIGRAKLREIVDHPQAFLQDKRSSLYLNFLEYVEYFRPLAVLMENVPDIMNYGGTNVAQEIAATLGNMGYSCRYTILNSAHYGVPEMRQRFYLMGFLTQLGIDPVFPAPTHAVDLPPGYDTARQVALGATQLDLFNHEAVRYVAAPDAEPGLPPAISAAEALKDLPPITMHLSGKSKRGVRDFTDLARYRKTSRPGSYASLMRTWPGFEATEGVFDHVTRNLPRDYPLFARMRPGDQYPQAHALAVTIFQEELERREIEAGHKLSRSAKAALREQIVPPYSPDKFPNKWRKMEPNLPARTLTAHIGKDTYSHIHYDSAQARTISVREAARLQSFPDGFRFTGPMNAAFRQIGNAVPPLQAFALAHQMRSLLETATSR